MNIVVMVGEPGHRFLHRRTKVNEQSRIGVGPLQCEQGQIESGVNGWFEERTEGTGLEGKRGNKNEQGGAENRRAGAN